MRVRISATIAYETDLTLDLYQDIKGGPKTEDEIIDFELEDPEVLTETLWESGTISDLKIEKLEPV